MVNTEKKSNGTNARKVIKIFAVFCDTVCTALLILVVSLIVFLLIYNSSQPTAKFFGNSFVYILSDSMNPDFKKGDLVFIEDCNPEDLAAGDIIAFYRNNSSEELSNIYFHRITDIKTGDGSVLYFRTKGDANRSPDSGWVKADSVVGVYNGRLAFLQQFLNFAVTVNGCIFLVIIPCGSIFMLEMLALINWLDQGARAKAGGARPRVNPDANADYITPDNHHYDAAETITEKQENFGNPPGNETDAENQLVIKEALSRCYDKIETIVIDKLSNEQ